MTEQLLEAARRHASGRVVSTLEGGYDLPALGASAAAHVRDADGGCCLIRGGGCCNLATISRYSRASIGKRATSALRIVLS